MHWALLVHVRAAGLEQFHLQATHKIQGDSELSIHGENGLCFTKHALYGQHGHPRRRMISTRSTDKDISVTKKKNAIDPSAWRLLKHREYKQYCSMQDTPYEYETIEAVQ